MIPNGLIKPRRYIQEISIWRVWREKEVFTMLDLAVFKNSLEGHCLVSAIIKYINKYILKVILNIQQDFFFSKWMVY